MRFGLIGCGGIGELRASALAQIKDSRLIAVNDLDRQRSGNLGARYGANIVDNWQELVKRDDVDAVIVSTPPSNHAEMSVAALENGKHVLCEKPLARNESEAEAMVAASRRSGKFLATGFNFRFYPSVIKARELFNAGLIGEIDYVRGYAGYVADTQEHPWMHDAQVVGGGALKDNGIHLIDLVGYFFGPVQGGTGYATSSIWNYPGCEENGFLLLSSSEGKVATLQASWTDWSGYRFQVEVYGKRGCIKISCFPMTTRITWSDVSGGSVNRKTFRFPKAFLMEHLKSYRWLVVDSFILEFKAFISVIAGSPSAIASGEDGLRALQIAEMAVTNKREQF